MTDVKRDSKTTADAEELSLLSRHHGFVLEALIDVDFKITRYNDTLAIERIKSKLENIRQRSYWTEEGLKDECFVRCEIAPWRQKIVFTHTHFIEELRILNIKLGIICPQLVWYIRVLRMDNGPQKVTWPCLLTITPKRFYAADIGEPENAFPGICLLVADANRRIVEVETLLEERI